ncbi:hypothetical protein [Methylobacterium sp. Leaf100]|uniref:hypothetical protein n=1 Tax=Methylobacterium sp. Leaf100 TaxID=1736252 RepID=UPI0006F675EA|nr:hypothetical protein [Methylobacterium sp. Leaf100]KQP36688.1 hypothetical protein ASF25_01665 [Methylobacterium sp. Leaf100]
MIKAILLKPLDGDPEGSVREFDRADFDRLEAMGAICVDDGTGPRRKLSVLDVAAQIAAGTEELARLDRLVTEAGERHRKAVDAAAEAERTTAERLDVLRRDVVGTERSTAERLDALKRSVADAEAAAQERKRVLAHEAEAAKAEKAAPAVSNKAAPPVANKGDPAAPVTKG